MPPKQIQATVIVLDVGRNVDCCDEKKGKTFFENAKEFTSRLIERKIMSQGVKSDQLIGVILLGSKNTNNSMAEKCSNAFRHVELYKELQDPSWKLIRDLPEMPTTKRGDWIDALVVAADYYKNHVSGIKLSDRKIILITNFEKKASYDIASLKQILDGFKDDDFEVDVIGPDIYSEDSYGQHELARVFIENTNGATATFEHAMRYLLFHKRKSVSVIPWNANLSIGPNIKIPVSVYLRIKDEAPVKRWLQAVKDPVTSTASTTEAVKKTKEYINPENQTVVESANTGSGYFYGHKIIPFSECDKTLLYESGEKCLSVYGFTQAQNIGWQNFNPSGLSYVYPRKGDTKSKVAIRCLVQCLHELKLFGIVRKVHNNNNAPKMFALMPVIDSNNYICLSMATICFKDEIKQMSFPTTNLKKFAYSKDQVNAFKELIAAMDLTKAYDQTFDDAEAFPTAETISPSVQYILDCIAYRAMNPGKPLPEPRDDIMSLFKMPPLVEKRSREPLNKLKKIFVLNKVEIKTKRNKNVPMDEDYIPEVDVPNNNKASDIMPKIQLITNKADLIDSIGTLDPIGDFKALKDQNKTLDELTPLMVKAIESLLHFNIDGDYSKPLNAMLHLRSEHVKTDPTAYNTWIVKLKLKLNESKKSDVVTLIKEKNADVILKEENSLSTYEDSCSFEDSQLYENNTVPDSTELTIRSEINDMFDEM